MKTALVVDDDTGIRLFVRRALEKRGWAVIEAEDGVDGLARVMLHAPDVLITDISMPRSDGMEMLEVLRSEGYLENARVVIMSGVLSLDGPLYKNTGATALLSKPFKLAALYAAVGEPYTHADEEEDD